MALITNSNVLSTSFTPAAGDFIVQAVNGIAMLQRQNATGAPWTNVGIVQQDMSPVVDNPVSTANYQFVAVAATAPLVRADQ